ncbi:MAG: hypothetical protein OES23_00155 [Nitrosopumilus sp.]|nr:hypothetical protein [Nitrosopumilus sp.]
MQSDAFFVVFSVVLGKNRSFEKIFGLKTGKINFIPEKLKNSVEKIEKSTGKINSAPER